MKADGFSSTAIAAAANAPPTAPLPLAWDYQLG